MTKKYFKDQILSFFNIDESTFNQLCDKEKELDELWYASNENDLSYYEKLEYVAIAYKCFVNYSENFVRCTKKFFGETTHGFLDYGAGIGLTTFMLSELFKDSTVYYQNIDGKQNQFAEFILKDKTNVKFNDYKNVDVILCSELFEHIKEPIKLLKSLCQEFSPKYFVISNSFRSRSYGHYSKYETEIGTVDNLKIGRLFNKELRNNGYVKEKIFWNGRPTIWMRK